VLALLLLICSAAAYLLQDKLLKGLTAKYMHRAEAQQKASLSIEGTLSNSKEQQMHLSTEKTPFFNCAFQLHSGACR